MKVAELKSVMSAEAKRVEAGSEQGALGKCRGELLMHLMKSNLCAAVYTNTWWHVVCCTVSAAWCPLHVVRCMLSAACCRARIHLKDLNSPVLLLVARCMLSAACCLRLCSACILCRSARRTLHVARTPLRVSAA